MKKNKKSLDVQKLSLFEPFLEGPVAEKIKVSLGENSYEIFIEAGLLEKIGRLFKEIKTSDRAVIVTHPNLKKTYGVKLLASLRKAGLEADFIEIPAGENYKNLEVASKIYDALVNFKIERPDALFALGGGLIGDLAGFVAATYLRGINFVQVPTTLLAQVDSSIGGKVGVNHPRGKNLIGAFYQPRAVFSDLDVLVSLPAREFHSGLAEVVKYGLIADSDFFEFLEKSAEYLEGVAKIFGSQAQKEILKKIVSRSAQIKAAVVEKDEKEKNLRMILNFGHTIGHALEAASNYSLYSHGEAVSIGMLVATLMAVKLNLTKKEVYERLKNLLKKLGLPTGLWEPGVEEIIKPLELDKKVLEKKIRFVLPLAIGQVAIYEDVDVSLVKSALSEHFLKARGDK